MSVLFCFTYLGMHHMKGGGKFPKTANILKTEGRVSFSVAFHIVSLILPWLLFKSGILKARQDV